MSKDMTDEELEKMTGYVLCEFPPDNDPCESCGEEGKQLYFHGPRDAGSYLCRECVVDLFQKNLEWGEALMGIENGK
jgi:hypothetical protein